MKMNEKEKNARRLMLQLYNDNQLKNYPPDKILYIIHIRNEVIYHERNPYSAFSFVTVLENIQKYLAEIEEN